jgi:hypothetical protein
MVLGLLGEWDCLLKNLLAPPHHLFLVNGDRALMLCYLLINVLA